MPGLTLVIGNKNYSSWSLRPWLLLRYFDIPFTEIRIPLYQQGSKQALAGHSPSGLVPALTAGTLKVWESLAICEYLHEMHPDAGMWPEAENARAIARSVSCEMHSGFTAVRNHMPMNCRKSFPGKGINADTRVEISRIQQIWQECRSAFGQSGPYLFGKFTIADAMYAPVALRFKTYQPVLENHANTYVETILAIPALQEWIDAAHEETEEMQDFEPYRNDE